MLDKAWKSLELLQQVVAMQKEQLRQIELMVESLDCMVTNMLHVSSVTQDASEDIPPLSLELLPAKPINHVTP